MSNILTTFSLRLSLLFGIIACNVDEEHYEEELSLPADDTAPAKDRHPQTPTASAKDRHPQTPTEPVLRQSMTKDLLHPSSGLVLEIIQDIVKQVSELAKEQRIKSLLAQVNRKLKHILDRYAIMSDAQKNRHDLVEQSTLLTDVDLKSICALIRQIADEYKSINEAESCNIKNTILGCEHFLQTTQNARNKVVNFNGMVLKRLEGLANQFIHYKNLRDRNYTSLKITDLQKHDSDPQAHYGLLLQLYEHHPRDIISNYKLLIEMIKMKNLELSKYRPANVNEECLKVMSLLFLHELLIHIIACSDIDDISMKFYRALRAKNESLPKLNNSKKYNSFFFQESFLHRFRAALVKKQWTIGNGKFNQLMHELADIESKIEDGYAGCEITDKKVIALWKTLKNNRIAFTAIKGSKCFHESYESLRLYLATRDKKR